MNLFPVPGIKADINNRLRNTDKNVWNLDVIEHLVDVDELDVALIALEHVVLVILVDMRHQHAETNTIHNIQY